MFKVFFSLFSTIVDSFIIAVHEFVYALAAPFEDAACDAVFWIQFPEKVKGKFEKIVLTVL